MSLISNILNRLDSSHQVEVAQKLLPAKYYDMTETIRLHKWIKETDFSQINVDGRNFCIINNGLFPYPLFQVSFFENMVANAIYCLSKGYAPVVGFKDPTENVNLWEQFMLQPYQADSFKAENCVGETCKIERAPIYFPLWPTKDEILTYSKIYKNIARLNEKTTTYIRNEINAVLGNKRVIGVLCRGTDYTANKPSGHPVQPEVSEIIRLVAQKMDELQCDAIYVATEEQKMFEQFANAFPGKVLCNKREYYDEFYELKKKAGEDTRISWVHHARENDNELKSLEYLSSIHILAHCTALIAGNAGGSRMALILNENRYEFSYLFNLGMYK